MRSLHLSSVGFLLLFISYANALQVPVPKGYVVEFLLEKISDAQSRAVAAIHPSDAPANNGHFVNYTDGASISSRYAKRKVTARSTSSRSSEGSFSPVRFRPLSQWPSPSADSDSDHGSITTVKNSPNDPGSPTPGDVPPTTGGQLSPASTSSDKSPSLQYGPESPASVNTFGVRKGGSSLGSPQEGSTTPQDENSLITPSYAKFYRPWAEGSDSDPSTSPPSSGSQGAPPSAPGGQSLPRLRIPAAPASAPPVPSPQTSQGYGNSFLDLKSPGPNTPSTN